jgi:hypothetical protein
MGYRGLLYWGEIFTCADPAEKKFIAHGRILFLA